MSDVLSLAKYKAILALQVRKHLTISRREVVARVFENLKAWKRLALQIRRNHPGESCHIINCDETGVNSSIAASGIGVQHDLDDRFNREQQTDYSMRVSALVYLGNSHGLQAMLRPAICLPHT